ncbi:hypothetical protein [Pseudomonas saliphila]|uniref:hypothetical protein n=1 Tax=Pseudomonas saliphila TaxID=2586906 RepID=UPI0012384DDC|nr:hypothetical protein [Pseudomonas saliphila]
MNTLKLALIVGMASLLAACGDPSLDTSSPANAEASMNRMMEDLSPEERNKLGRNLASITLHYALNPPDGLSLNSMMEAEARINKELDGKTYKEIDKLASDLR